MCKASHESLKSRLAAQSLVLRNVTLMQTHNISSFRPFSLFHLVDVWNRILSEKHQNLQSRGPKVDQPLGSSSSRYLLTQSGTDQQIWRPDRSSHSLPCFNNYTIICALSTRCSELYFAPTVSLVSHIIRLTVEEDRPRTFSAAGFNIGPPPDWPHYLGDIGFLSDPMILFPINN